MHNFVFHIPTEIYFGKGTQQNIGKIAKQYGSRVLLLYGSERVVKNGLLGELTKNLQQEDISVYKYGGIQANPLLSKAKEIAKYAIEERIELLIAVGGGSVIDTAKAVSIAAVNKADLWTYYEQGKEVPKALPVGCVVTMAATASEANCVSVLSHDSKKQKKMFAHPQLFPRFSILNPELTYTASPKQTAVGAIDIFSHAFERYFCLEQRGTLRNKLCGAIMQTVVAELPKAMESPCDYDSRAQLMWAATMAHSDMIGTEGVFACHEMSHVLTEEYGLAHGVALAILMPAWLKFMLPWHMDLLAEFAREVWGEELKGCDDVEASQEGIFKMQQFIGRCHLPLSLHEAGINTRNSERLAEKLLTGRDYVGEAFEKINKEGASIIFQMAE
ncbi:MAG: iron-containing alcohol dehydrogenase [Eubacterium sp.]|nr:iron-containing alcohol dehydrogenase [Eubacterium sp.]